MLKHSPRFERGQSLVVIALASIVLIAFVGLAIDGGLAYSQRRVAQNAGDAAAIRGAYTVSEHGWRLNPNRVALLRALNAEAERHGVPDTTGNPGDEFNDNVVAFYTDINGVTIGNGCTVATCTTIPNDPDPWGVEVLVSLPFRTMFAGVIGRNSLTVGSHSVAVTHAGARGFNEDHWAVFATDKLSCSGTGGYEVVDNGSTNVIQGNAHSNGNFQLLLGARVTGANSQITYVNSCSNCISSIAPEATAKLDLVFPDFDTYKDLADNGSRTTGTRYAASGSNGHTCPNMVPIVGHTRPTLVWKGSGGTEGIACQGTRLGSTGLPVFGQPTPRDPITYIDGDLVISRTDTTNVTLAGLIVVNGDVVIDAPRVLGANPGGFSLLATGTIKVTDRNQILTGVAYSDPRTPPYSPLLMLLTNVAIFYSDKNVSSDGRDPCAVPVIQMLGDRFTLQGAIMAPHGRVEIVDGGPNKLLTGTVIGDAVQISGANININYYSAYFPPQPDLIELLE